MGGAAAPYLIGWDIYIYADINAALCLMLYLSRQMQRPNGNAIRCAAHEGGVSTSQNQDLCPR